MAGSPVSKLTDLATLVAGLARRIGELERRARGQSMEGRVVEADPAKGMYRVDLGDGFVTDWLPARSSAAGALKIQAEPTVGQMVMVRSESGDLTDAAIESSGFTDARPHDKNGELFVSVGGSSLLVTPDRITMSSNGSALTLSAAGIALTGSALTHNGKNVGDTHVHGGVQSGGSTTSTPV